MRRHLAFRTSKRNETNNQKEKQQKGEQPSEAAPKYPVQSQSNEGF